MQMKGEQLHRRVSDKEKKDEQLEIRVSDRR
jgi:hypothetical protein